MTLEYRNLLLRRITALPDHQAVGWICALTSTFSLCCQIWQLGTQWGAAGEAWVVRHSLLTQPKWRKQGDKQDQNPGPQEG